MIRNLTLLLIIILFLSGSLFSADTTSPAAVNLSIGAITKTSIQIKWTAPGDDDHTGQASAYDIRYSPLGVIDTLAKFNAAGQVSGEGAPQVSGSAESFMITGLITDTLYYFALRSSDEVPNWSSLSNSPPQTTLESVAPSAITDLSAITGATEGKINLSWTAPGDDGNSGQASSYIVKYSVNSITTQIEFDSAQTYSQTWTPVISGNTEQRTIAGLSGGTTYYISIVAVDDAGNQGMISNTTGNNAWAQVDVTPPGKIITLQTGKVTGTTAQLIWTAPGDDEYTGKASIYDIRYTTAGHIDTESKFTSAVQVSGEPAPKTAGSFESFTVGGLLPQTIYYFAIKTGDEIPNWSLISNSIEAIDNLAPQEVGGITGKFNSGNFQLTWSPVTTNADGSPIAGDVAGYNIYRSDEFSGPFNKIVSLASGYNTWIETASSSDIYYYKIKAFDIAGNESMSDTLIDNTPESILYFTGPENTVLLSVPKKVSTVLYANSNYTGNDLRVRFIRNSNDEKDRILYAFEMQAVNVNSGEIVKGITFTSPKANLVFSIPENISEKDCSIFWHNGVEIVKLGGNLNKTDRTISIKVTNFGHYYLQQSLAATQFAVNQVVPRKIFTPNNDDINDYIEFYFDNPGDDIVTGEIYDITGNFIAQMEQGDTENSRIWDGRDSSDRTSRVGVYIYQLKAGKKVINGTVILAK